MVTYVQIDFGGIQCYGCAGLISLPVIEVAIINMTYLFQNKFSPPRLASVHPDAQVTYERPRLAQTLHVLHRSETLMPSLTPGNSSGNQRDEYK